MIPLVQVYDGGLPHPTGGLALFRSCLSNHRHRQAREDYGYFLQSNDASSHLVASHHDVSLLVLRRVELIRTPFVCNNTVSWSSPTLSLLSAPLELEHSDLMTAIVRMCELNLLRPDALSGMENTNTPTVEPYGSYVLRQIPRMRLAVPGLESRVTYDGR